MAEVGSRFLQPEATLPARIAKVGMAGERNLLELNLKVWTQTLSFREGLSWMNKFTEMSTSSLFS